MRFSVLLFTLLLCILVPIKSSAQMSKFDELSNKMFFNIGIYHPDSMVFDFIQNYFPYYTKKPEPGGWKIYPPTPATELQSTVHSLVFKKHPHFNTAFKSGRLDILTSEHKKQPGRSTEDFQLWFMFDNKCDADDAFQKLSSMFDSISKNKNIKEVNGKSVAEYSDQQNGGELNSVRFILTKDELKENGYKLFFRISTYPEE